MKAIAVKSTNGLWAVKQDGGVIYAPVFNEAQAERLAELENTDDPPDWEHAKEILEKEKLL